MSKFDVIVYGATGFTGKIAVKYLTEDPRYQGLKICLAGRDESKLKALSDQTRGNPSYIVAPSSEPELVEKMVAQGKVILNFAGPFALFAEPVIRAVAQQGKIYLDITGETPFIRTMIDRYQGLAEENKAFLIPFSGFDSVPADLMCFLLSEEGALDHMRGYYRLRGGFNGGTLASAIEMAEQGLLTKLGDSKILVPDPNFPKVRSHAVGPTFDQFMKLWIAPFIMGPINRAIVMRSFWLTKKAPVQYEEYQIISRKFKGLASLVASGIIAGGGLAMSTSIGRNLLRKIGPKPGEGPNEAFRAHSKFSLEVVGYQSGHAKVKASISRDGDPGNEITVLCAIESAKLAVEGRIKSEKFGFLTPSVAYGSELITRLKEVGFSIEKKAF